MIKLQNAYISQKVVTIDLLPAVTSPVQARKTTALGGHAACSMPIAGAALGSDLWKAGEWRAQPRIAAEPACGLGLSDTHLSPGPVLSVWREIGAGDEIRTHDPYLGKVMLYP
jgi:hypothetical protein